MTNRMWGGRFDEGPDAVMEEINASIDFDRKLFRQDIAASQAHARMLAATGIVAADDAEKIVDGLDTILREIEAGEFTFSRGLEDIHTNVEARLAELIGPGGRPAAHRALAERPGGDRFPPLGARRHRRDRRGARATCSGRSPRRRSSMPATVMPGFTHLQTRAAGDLRPPPARLCRDDRRATAAASPTRARGSTNCPLGSAALAGTSFPIDRKMTATALGFDAADGEFARRRLRPRLRRRDACRGEPLRRPSVALRRGDRDLVVAGLRLHPALRPVHHRLVDHAAEAQSGCGRAGAGQERAHHRRADRRCWS